MQVQDKILVAGGYGQVGAEITRLLAPRYPGRVVAAGRNQSRAEALADIVGFGVEGRRIDVFAYEEATRTLDDVGTVVMCLDQEDPGFAAQCLDSGVRYVDISATYAFLRRIESLDVVARERGVAAVVSVGVAPGLTNVLAALADARMEATNRVDIFILFGMADSHGKAAVEWMFDNLDASFEVQEAGRLRSVQSLDEAKECVFPGDARSRKAFRFNFSDQRVIARTLNVPTVSTWICFESRLFTQIMSFTSRFGVARFFRLRPIRNVAVTALSKPLFGSDICVLRVDAHGVRDGKLSTTAIALKGRKEAKLTALIAAEITTDLTGGAFSHGVHHIEQLVDPSDFIERLCKADPELDLITMADA